MINVVFEASLSCDIDTIEAVDREVEFGQGKGQVVHKGVYSSLPTQSFPITMRICNCSCHCLVSQARLTFCGPSDSNQLLSASLLLYLSAHCRRAAFMIMSLYKRHD